MRALVLRVIFGSATLVAAIAPAQMHKVAKPQQVVRAVGVYEWTGDFAKPTASRLIPVSLFIEGKFEDAGVYIARPVPFALLTGNLYILQDAGLDKATFDLVYSKHLQAVEPTGDLAFDDGWFGYGSVKPLSAPKKTAALKPSKTLPVLTTSPDPNRPHLGSKPGGDTASTGSDQSNPTNKPDTTTASGTTNTSTSDDPNRPTMKRRGSDTSGSGTSTTTSSTDTSSTASPPADDPDRPTMKRHTPDSNTSGSDSTTTPTSTTQTGTPSADDPDRPTMKRRTSDSTPTDTASTADSAPASDDPDRPTLKRHTAEDAKKAKVAATDIPGVSATGSLNDDPNRPNLHHGKPTSAMTETDLPKLTGLPPNLHQMVAISDAVNRDPHPFTLDWDDEAQHKAILEKMQGLARAQLAAYGATPATAAPASAPAVKKTTPAATRAHRPATPQTPLLDEELKAYTLSYGGAATYVYSANTGGTGAALRYVTIVAQADSLGDIKPAIQSVTDAAHFNRTPKMKFVDVVDADATNRASLLFELRSQNARQFALYRVIASHPEQIFLTGTTQ
ncbi:MAG TPA: hypothetical protein VH117_04005 [Edaphobacter sp.]|jgi:hypothetical protein|nr:hypothetical protein [Edaphobacter sp.]